MTKKKLNLTYREVFDRAGLSFNENTALFVFVDHKYILDDLIEEQFLDDFDSFIHECYEADILLKILSLKDFNHKLDSEPAFKERIASKIATDFCHSIDDEDVIIYSVGKLVFLVLL